MLRLRVVTRFLLNIHDHEQMLILVSNPYTHRTFVYYKSLPQTTYYMVMYIKHRLLYFRHNIKCPFT